MGLKCEQELCEAVFYWLQSEIALGKKGLLAEGMLTVPVANYLNTKVRVNTASGSAPKETTQSEVNHPSWKGCKGPGRPPQVDIAILTKSRKFKLAMEMKLAFKKRSSLSYELAQDVVRLALIPKQQDYDRWLLLAGKGNIIQEAATSKAGLTKESKPHESCTRCQDTLFPTVQKRIGVKIPTVITASMLGLMASGQTLSESDTAVVLWSIGKKSGCGYWGGKANDEAAGSDD